MHQRHTRRLYKFNIHNINQIAQPWVTSAATEHIAHEWPPLLFFFGLAYSCFKSHISRVSIYMRYIRCVIITFAKCFIAARGRSTNKNNFLHINIACASSSFCAATQTLKAQWKMPSPSHRCRGLKYGNQAFNEGEFRRVLFQYSIHDIKGLYTYTYIPICRLYI